MVTLSTALKEETVYTQAQRQLWYERICYFWTCEGSGLYKMNGILVGTWAKILKLAIFRDDAIRKGEKELTGSQYLELLELEEADRKLLAEVRQAVRRQQGLRLQVEITRPGDC